MSRPQRDLRLRCELLEKTNRKQTPVVGTEKNFTCKKRENKIGRRHPPMVGPEENFTWCHLALSLPRLPSPPQHGRLEVVVAKHLEGRQGGGGGGGGASPTWMPCLMEKWCNWLVTFKWNRSSTVRKLSTRPSTLEDADMMRSWKYLLEAHLASRKASLYWGRPTSSSHLGRQG